MNFRRTAKITVRYSVMHRDGHLEEVRRLSDHRSVSGLAQLIL